MVISRNGSSSWPRWIYAISCSLLLISSLSGSALGQQKDNLYDVSVIGGRQAWIAGAFGTILHTADAGASWNRQDVSVGEHLFGVGFADEKTGWAVGRTGVILFTRDGGEIWEIQDAPIEDRHLFDVYAASAKRAVAIGDWGTILVTEDGGATWQNRSFPRDVILNGQAWADATTGWIVGEAGTIIATTDGGKTWVEQQSGVFKTLFGVSFRDAQNGWAAGLDGLILRTTDGGNTWTTQRGAASVGSFDEVVFAEAFDNPTLFDIDIRGQYGAAVGDLGGLFTSKDGGESWQRKVLGGEAGLQWIRAVALDESGAGFFVGGKGLTATISGDKVTTAR